MKKILITGANSYIGLSFKEWMQQWPQKYKIDSISVKSDEWRKKSFREYDAILHVAGIAHVKETVNNTHLYYNVNRDLAIAIATKAKQEDVNQFIFLSSMSVYGIDQGIITRETIPNPKSSYGKSKYEAELEINKLENENFKISILRPPMVYGKECKGNFMKLDKLANKTPIFPKVDNKRSMIYIENLCEFIKITIDKEITGLLYPQNIKYICTSQMVKNIGESKGRKIILIMGFEKVFKIASKKIGVISKIFGNLIYDMQISDIRYDYQVVDFEESIKRSL